MTNAVAVWACVSPKIRDRVAGVLVVKAASGWGERRDAMCVLRSAEDARRVRRGCCAEPAGDMRSGWPERRPGRDGRMSSARVALGWETPRRGGRDVAERRAERRSEKRESKSVSKHSKRARRRRLLLAATRCGAPRSTMLRGTCARRSRGGGSGPLDRREDGAEGGRHRARRAAVRVARQRGGDHVSPLIPGTYVGDKTSDYPSSVGDSKTSSGASPNPRW